VSIVRFDPPKRPRHDPWDVIKTFGRFAVSPIETVLGLATSREPKDWGQVYNTVPVEFNTDTGAVAVETTKETMGKGRAKWQPKNADRERVQGLLQTTVNTGVIPDTLPIGYLPVAEQLAKLGQEYPRQAYYRWPKVDNAPAPEQPLPEQTENFDMGILPPGGLAGFAQMMPASKLALMGGRRTRSTGGRRRKRKAKKTAKRRTRRASAKRGKKRLVKGSAAAKRYMASIRKKRRG